MDELCLVCSQQGDYCFECEAGYFVLGGKCLACSEKMSHCLECSGDGATCKKCDDNYSIKKNQCCNTGLQAECEQCSDDGDGCSQCLNGFYV